MRHELFEPVKKHLRTGRHICRFILMSSSTSSLVQVTWAFIEKIVNKSRVVSCFVRNGAGIPALWCSSRSFDDQDNQQPRSHCHPPPQLPPSPFLSSSSMLVDDQCQILLTCYVLWPFSSVFGVKCPLLMMTHSHHHLWLPFSDWFWIVLMLKSALPLTSGIQQWVHRRLGCGSNKRGTKDFEPFTSMHCGYLPFLPRCLACDSQVQHEVTSMQ